MYLLLTQPEQDKGQRLGLSASGTGPAEGEGVATGLMRNRFIFDSRSVCLMLDGPMRDLQ